MRGQPSFPNVTSTMVWMIPIQYKPPPPLGENAEEVANRNIYVFANSSHFQRGSTHPMLNKMAQETSLMKQRLLRFFLISGALGRPAAWLLIPWSSWSTSRTGWWENRVKRGCKTGWQLDKFLGLPITPLCLGEEGNGNAESKYVSNN